MRTISSIALVLISVVALAAAEPHAAHDEGVVGIEFAPPPLEGTISLVVYRADGTLVRVLKEAAETGDFEIGLNGLITEWDGKDDAGKEVASGTYSVRGVMVGDLVIEGEAFLGNDWVGENGEPRLREVQAIAAKADGTLVLLATNAAGQTVLALSDADGRVVWSRLLPAGDWSDQLAANESAIFVASAGTVLRFDFAGQELPPLEVSGIDQIAAGSDRVALATSSGIQVRGADGSTVSASIPLPGPVEAMAVSGSQLVIAQNGKVSAWQDKSWHPLELPSLTRAISVSLSAADTIWLVDAGADHVALKEYSLTGNFLRHLGTAADAPQPSQALIARAGRLLYLLENRAGENRVRGLELVDSRPEEGPGAAEVSTWDVALSQSIQNVGTVEAATPLLGGFKAAVPLSVSLRPNPLQPDQPKPSASLQVLQRGEENVLALADGLPLRVVATTPGLKWSLIGRRPNAKTITILQSDGVVIEEFSLLRPANLMTFDAGDFAWPREKPAPVEEEDVPPAAPDSAGAE